MPWAQTVVVGALAGDPELKYLNNGRAVCNFSIPITETWNNAQKERQERTTWYRVAVWGPQAESCNNNLRKGSTVCVHGNVTARAYINKSGEAVASLDLAARRVSFEANWGRQQGGQGNQGNQQQAPRQNAPSRGNNVGGAGDIPF